MLSDFQERVSFKLEFLLYANMVMAIIRKYAHDRNNNTIKEKKTSTQHDTSTRDNNMATTVWHQMKKITDINKKIKRIL